MFAGPTPPVHEAAYFALGSFCAVLGVLLFRWRRSHTLRRVPVEGGARDSFTEVARGVSGELADLATAIEGDVELLCETLGQPSRLPARIERLWRDLERLRSFSEKLQALAHVGPAELQVVDLRPLLDALRDDVERHTRGGVEVQCSVAECLPLALTNPELLSKALRFVMETMFALEEGAPALSIEATTRIADGEAPSINLRIAAHARGQGEGAGEARSTRVQLGYTAARNLLEAGGGSLVIEHAPGSSAEARVHLPAAAAGAAAPPPEPLAPGREPDPQVHPYGGVLVLEPDPSLRELIVEEMARWNRRAVPCRDAAAAAALLGAAAERFELLIVQARGPDSRGLRVALESLKTNPGLRALLLVDGPEGISWPAEHRERCAVLAKPFGAHTLREVVAGLLPEPQAATPPP